MRWLLLLGLLAWAQKPYFQQRVAYKIKVTLDPEKALLRGHLRLIYENRSPDTLYGLYLHLWPNAYQNRRTPYARQERRGGSTKFYFSKAAERGWIDSLDFRIDGESVRPLPAKAGPPPAPGYSQALLRRASDVVWLPFPHPLPPNQKITLETPFRVKVPVTFSRLGHDGPQFQITQWYPKPAVYDRKGWHPLPYLDLGEFYSEWGQYEVEITVPSTYVVGATGVLQERAEQAWLQAREKATRTWLESNQAGSLDWDTSLSAPPKTLHFFQDSVHDFAWFADPRYAILTDTITLPNGHRVACVALFRPAYAKAWKEAPRYIAEAIQNLSKWVGPYPYAHATAVEGALSAGGGMEYPMITVIKTSKEDDGTLRTVIHHEVGHNWFQGLLASNERLHPWQDEGINSYYEKRLDQAELEDSTPHRTKLKVKVQEVELPIFGGYDARLSPNPLFYGLHYWNLDQPFSQSSEYYSSLNYGLGVYQRTAALLQVFSECVGRPTWDEGMRHYFRRWAFRHPYPEDWAAALEEKGLPAQSFLRLLNNEREPDFRLQVRRLGPQTLLVSTQEPKAYWEGLCLPLLIVGRRDTVLLEKTLKVGTTDTISLPEKARLLVINPQQVPFERRIGNNYWPKGLFHRLPDLKLHVGPVGIAPIYKLSLGLTPLLGYNYRDGLLVGVLVNHGLFPKRLVELHALPMYSPLRGSMRGSAGLTLRAFPSSSWHLVELRLRASNFAGFVRTKAALEWHRRAPYDRFGWAHTFRFRAYQLGSTSLETWRIHWENGGRPAYLALDWEGRREEGILTLYTFLSAGHDLRGHLRTEGEARFYWRPLRKWFLWGRLYSGYVTNGAAPYLLIRPAGFDPFGEKVLLDRFRESGRLPSRQMPETQGGWRTPSDTLISRALLAMNLEVPIPSLSMVRLRFDAGYLPIARRSYYGFSLGVPVIRGRDRLLAGLYFPVWGDTFGPSRTPQRLKDSLIRAVWHVEVPLDLRGVPIGLF